MAHGFLHLWLSWQNGFWEPSRKGSQRNLVRVSLNLPNQSAGMLRGLERHRF